MSNNNIPKIGFGAGHGLGTAGKETPTGIKEWTLNDKVRDKVVAILSEYNCEFIHVDNDEGVKDESLTSRKNMYLNAHVDAFVSFHHNAYTSTWNGATGVEVFVDRNYTEEDMRLAECIYHRLVEYTGLKGRGIKKANFTVIKQNKIPAVLVEGGFMDSTIDYKIITSEEGQEAYARAVAEGLIEFLALEKKGESKKELLEIDGSWGRDTTLKSQQVFGTKQDGKISHQPNTYKDKLSGCKVSSWEFDDTRKGSQLIRAIQTFLKDLGFYTGKIDGLCEKKTATAIQQFLASIGLYTGEINAKMEPETVSGWQMYINSRL